MDSPLHRIGPALLLSLAVHGLLALALTRVSLSAARVSLDDTRVEDTGSCLALSLADLPRVAEAPPAPGEEEQSVSEVDFAVSVREAPATPDTSASPAAATPVVVGLPRASHPASATTSGAPGVPTPARPSVLQAPRSARSVVYVLDRSLSMGPDGALDRARRELLASLDQLPAGTRFQVILYNRQAEPLRVAAQSGFLQADQPTRAEVARQLASVPAAGNTDHLRALRRGLLLQPDVLFLITDADELSDRDVLEATRQNDGHTVINTVEVGHRHTNGDSPLHRLASRNGGTYRCLQTNE